MKLLTLAALLLLGTTLVKAGEVDQDNLEDKLEDYQCSVTSSYNIASEKGTYYKAKSLADCLAAGEREFNNSYEEGILIRNPFKKTAIAKIYKYWNTKVVVKHTDENGFETKKVFKRDKIKKEYLRTEAAEYY